MDIEKNIEDTLLDDETSNFQNENNDSPVSSTEQEFVELQIDSNIEPNDPNDNSLNSNLHGERRDDNYQEETVDETKSPENNSEIDVEILSCYICKFVTTVKVAFTVHQQTDHDKICVCCDYITTTDCLLNEHKEIYGHFLCGFCDFQANREKLKTHCRYEHGSLQNFGEESETNKTSSTDVNAEANILIQNPMSVTFANM